MLDRISVQFVYAARDTKVIAVAGVTGGSGRRPSRSIWRTRSPTSRTPMRPGGPLAPDGGDRVAPESRAPSTRSSTCSTSPAGSTPISRKRALIRVADNLEILAGPHKLAAPVNTSPQDVAQVVNIMKQISDVVVLDLPCTYDALYFETLTAANQAIMIGEQKLPSIRALKMVREAIGAPAGPSTWSQQVRPEDQGVRGRSPPQAPRSHDHPNGGTRRRRDEPRDGEGVYAPAGIPPFPRPGQHRGPGRCRHGPGCPRPDQAPGTPRPPGTRPLNS